MKQIINGKIFVAILLGIVLSLQPDGVLMAAPEAKPLRIGVTPVFLNYQTALLNDWRDYLSARLKRPIRFVQRTTYREITDLLQENKIDFAWICGYPYMRLRSKFRLATVPLYQGKPLYQAYLIVPSSDTETQSISNLKGKIFAHSDPDSNSGFLVPQHQIHQLGEDRNNFFRKSIFTWAHEKVVEAVAFGVTNGGSVDGYIWDTLSKLNPQLTAGTRIVEKSQSFGFPPIVARANISENEFLSVRQEFLDMNKNGEGKALLNRLNLDGFSIQDDSIYDGIAKIIKELDGG